MKKTAIISKKGFCIILFIIAVSENSTAMGIPQTSMSPSDNVTYARETASLNNCQIKRPGDLRPAHEKTVSSEGVEILDIRIKGNVDMDNAMVLRVFGLENGTFFSEKRAEIGIERLKKLSAVKNAYLRKKYNHKGNGVYLTLILQKSKTLNIYPIASRTFADKLSIGFKISELNFRRRYENLNFSFLFRGATIFRATWDKPHLGDMPLLGFRFNIKYQNYTYPYPEFEEAFLNDRVKRLESVASLRFHINDFFSILISPGIDQIFGKGPVLKETRGENIFTESHEGLFSTFEISILNIFEKLMMSLSFCKRSISVKFLSTCSIAVFNN
jgi:hypothetical protein